MSTFPRESSFLPTIKCSLCGDQIEISMMGDHVCRGPSTESLPIPPDSAASNYSTFSEAPSSANDKYARLPPQVDTRAANGSYLLQGQLTPISNSSGSRSLSPRTPDGRTGTSRGNDYFEPAIASEYESTPPPTRRQPGYGGFSERDDWSGLDPLYPASSPKKETNLLQRMNTIAPGPFEMGPNRRPRTPITNAVLAREHLDTTDFTRMTGPGTDRPGTSASNMSSLSGSVNKANPLSSQSQRKNGYGGFGSPPKPQDDFEPPMLNSNNRSDTFPRPNPPADPPLRTPSAPGARPSTRGESRGPQNGMRDTSRPPPPRKSSIRPSTSGRDGSRVNLEMEFGSGNPFTSSDSSPGSYRYKTSTSTTSSGTSASRSNSTRTKTDTSGFDSLMSDLQSSIGDMQGPDDDKDRQSRFDRDGTNAARPRQGSQQSTRSRSRQRSRTRERVQPPVPPAFNLQAELARLKDNDPAPVVDSVRSLRSQPRRNGSDAASSYGSASPDRSARGAGPSPDRGMSPAQRPLQTSRGDCKSCGLAITGKSISSADGRLTGRYHKACFVCATCSQPFSSSEFYVLNDKPYCELHYHTLNGSLCGTCGKGIEGQYLEDESMVKYHVGCFRCADCGRSLSSDYFEVDGKAYCERDAWRRVQLPPSTYNNGPGPMGSIRDTNMSAPMPMQFPRTPRTPGPMMSSAPPSRYPSMAPRENLPLPPMGMGMGMRRPSAGQLPPQAPLGLPRGQRVGPGVGFAPRPPRMNKRITRLGMM